MGIQKLSAAEHYWSSDPILSVPAVSHVMTRNSFKEITSNLYLNSIETMIGKDKLHKIRPVIDQMNDSIHKAYVHSNKVSVDESMINFKGRSSLKE